MAPSYSIASYNMSYLFLVLVLLPLQALDFFSSRDWCVPSPPPSPPPITAHPQPPPSSVPPLQCWRKIAGLTTEVPSPHSLSVISCFSSSLGTGPATPSAVLEVVEVVMSVRQSVSHSSQSQIGEVCFSARGLQPAVVIHPRFELNTIQHFLYEDLQNSKINEMKSGKWLYWLLKSRATNTNTWYQVWRIAKLHNFKLK